MSFLGAPCIVWTLVSSPCVNSCVSNINCAYRYFEINCIDLGISVFLCLEGVLAMDKVIVSRCFLHLVKAPVNSLCLLVWYTWIYISAMGSLWRLISDPTDFCRSISHLMWTIHLSLPRVINFKFPLQPHQKYTPHSMKNLAFHSLLRLNMVILPFPTT